MCHSATPRSSDKPGIHRHVVFGNESCTEALILLTTRYSAVLGSAGGVLSPGNTHLHTVLMRLDRLIPFRFQGQPCTPIREMSSGMNSSIHLYWRGVGM